MEVSYNLSEGKKYKNVALTVGFYDGVHKGHQRIIKELVKRAKMIRGKSCVVTFTPHPLELFSHQPFHLLTALEEKKEIFAKLNVDLVVVFNFTSQFASLSPYSFIKKLKENIDIKEIIVGKDFVFGRGREGNIQWLKRFEDILGYKLRVISLLETEEEKISSSLIRKLLRKGEISKAIQYLGHPPTIIGKIVKGRRRGYLLGYPTANLKTYPYKILPLPGVYAGKVILKEKTYKGIVNVGDKPTFRDTSFGVEVHIIDFEEEIYGETIKIELIDKMRKIEDFPSPLYLSKKLKEDREKAEKILNSVGKQK